MPQYTVYISLLYTIRLIMHILAIFGVSYSSKPDHFPCVEYEGMFSPILTNSLGYVAN